MLIKVYGDPVPKGSMKCVGRGNRHQLVDNKRNRLEPWTLRIVGAAKEALERRDGFQLLGPIDITLTITVLRPKSVPYRDREWPTSLVDGDWDKHARAVGDALTRSELIRDDSQIVHGDVWMAYPDTWACPGRLDRPGITLRVEELPVSGPPPETMLFGDDQ